MLARWGLAGIFLLIHVVFFGCSIYFGYKRPLILLEWFIPFMLFYFERRVLFIFCSVLILILEGLLALCQIYLLVKPLEWLYMLKYIGYTNVSLLLLITVVIILFLSMFIFISFVFKAKQQFYIIFGVLVFSGIINFIPSLNGINSIDSAKLYRQQGVKVLGSGILMLERFTTELDMQVLNEEKSGSFGNKYWDSPTASENLKNPGVKQDKILFVTVESWGLPNDKAIFHEQILPLIESKNLKMITTGSVNFLGSTVSGEMRELCGLYVNSIGLSDLQDKASKCLPNQFQKEGYIVNAYHAASGSMYDRNKWYQVIGFKQPVFFMEKKWNIERCYSFPGWCDIGLLDYIWDEIPRGEKTFSYWLTLNSHFPYSKRDIAPVSMQDIVLCKKLNLGALEAPRCRNFILNRQLFSAIAKKSQQLPIQNLTIILVGDHVPVFIEESDRESFSRDKVPMLILQTGVK